MFFMNLKTIVLTTVICMGSAIGSLVEKAEDDFNVPMNQSIITYSSDFDKNDEKLIAYFKPIVFHHAAPSYANTWGNMEWVVEQYKNNKFIDKYKYKNNPRGSFYEVAMGGKLPTEESEKEWEESKIQSPFCTVQTQEVDDDAIDIRRNILAHLNADSLFDTQQSEHKTVKAAVPQHVELEPLTIQTFNDLWEIPKSFKKRHNITIVFPISSDEESLRDDPFETEPKDNTCCNIF